MRANKGIASLTGVRGIAAIWVFLSHFYGFAALVLHAPSLLHSVFLFNGFRGVDLFFVLSGFILMHVHAEQFRSIRRHDLRQFFLARFFRVYPLNTAVLLATLVVVLLLPGYVASERDWTDPHFAYRADNFSFAGFVQTLLLVQSWTVLKLGEWNIVSWTLSAEILGYLLFPVMAWALMRERSASRCIMYATLSLVVLTVILFAAHHANNNPTGTFGSIRMIFCFLAGIALNRAYQIAGDRWARAATPMTIVASLFLAMTWLVPVLPVLDVFGFAALVLGLSYQRGPIDAMLSSKYAISLGRISFSFYLVHFMIIKLVSWSVGDWLTMQSLDVRIAGLCGVTLMCFATGVVCYRLIEQPSQRLGRRVTARYLTASDRESEERVGPPWAGNQVRRYLALIFTRQKPAELTEALGSAGSSVYRHLPGSDNLLGHGGQVGETYEGSVSTLLRSQSAAAGTSPPPLS